MKREFSLKGKKLFKEVYKKGKRYKGKGITIFVLEVERDNNKKKIIKIGISARKYLGKAHARNYYKRWIRSLCKGYVSRIHKNFYIIIKPEQEILNLSYNETHNSLVSLFNKAGVL